MYKNTNPIEIKKIKNQHVLHRFYFLVKKDRKSGTKANC